MHRNDLVLEKMNQPEAMAPVLREITGTLRKGNSVWLVGSVPVVRPKQLPPMPPPPPPGLPTQWWLGSYLYCWNTQVTVQLLDHAQQEQAQKIPAMGPVSSFEETAWPRWRHPDGAHADGQREVEKVPVVSPSIVAKPHVTATKAGPGSRIVRGRNGCIPG